MSQDQNPDEDILLKLSMVGKPLRTRPQDAPKILDQQPTPASSSQSPSLSTSPSASLSPSPPASQQPFGTASPVAQQPSRPSEVYQPRRETNTVVPPANTPPASEAAQENILRKLTMKPKDYILTPPEASPEPEVRPSPGSIYQTPEEARSNRPYVSSDSEIEHIKKMAQNIIGSDVVQKRTQKK